MSLTVILCVACMFMSAKTVDACRFTVRDVGFVDLQAGTHYVFFYVDKSMPQDFLDSLEQTVNTVLSDTNIYAEIVNNDQSAGHPAAEFLTKHNIDSLPAAILMLPDERTVPLVTDVAVDAFNEELTSAVESILYSPKQDEILEKASRTYGTVLIIDGKNTEENAAAIASAKAAIKSVEANMDFLPKPIEKPPVLTTLTRDEFQREQNLLRFLDLVPDKIEHAHAVVFFGRSRQLGPVLTGETLSEYILTNILAIIGADCECGLDRRWMQGPMLPTRVTETMRTDLLESLGFDLENPMVKMEISMILRRGPMSPGGFGGFNPLSPEPFGYQEIDVDFGTQDDEPNSVTAVLEDTSADNSHDHIEPSTDENTVTAIPNGLAEPSDRTDTDTASQPSPRIDASLMLAVLLVFGVTVAVISTGMIILIRARRSL